MSSPEPTDTRRTRRLWLTLSGIFAVLLSLILYLYAFHDIPPPDPALYQVDFKPIPPGENALEVFEKETQALRQAATENWTKRWQEDERLLTYAPGCETGLENYIATHRALLERFWRLVKEDQRPLGYPNMSLNVDETFNPTFLSGILECGQLARHDIAVKVFRGRPDLALFDSIRLISFSKELSQADNHFIHWLVPLAIQNQALEGMQCALSGSASTPVNTREKCDELRKGELSPTDLAKTFRIGGLARQNTWIRRELGMLPPEVVPVPSRFSRITLKPHMTMRENLDITLILSKGLQAGWLHGVDATRRIKAHCAGLLPSYSWKNQIHPNRWGRVSVSSAGSTLALIVTKTIQTVVHNRCLQTALALRTYELEKGSLPASLEELVPHILPSLPQDPVTGTALSWNPQTGRIYSVGENEKDDGGDFEPSKAMKNQKDWGILYPWHPVRPAAP